MKEISLDRSFNLPHYNRLDEKRMEGLRKIVRKTLLEISSTECDGCAYFDMDSILKYVEFEYPLYSILEKWKTAKLVFISPKQYIYKIASGFGGLSYDDAMGPAELDDRKKVKTYAEAMKQGDKFPIGFYTKGKSNQEGRHRAIAAMLLGAKLIPVIEKVDLSDKDVSFLIEKWKNMEFEELNQLFIKMGFDEGISSLGYNSLKRRVANKKKEKGIDLHESSMDFRTFIHKAIHSVIHGRVKKTHMVIAMIEVHDPKEVNKLIKAAREAMRGMGVKVPFKWKFPQGYHMTVKLGQLPLGIKMRGDVNKDIELSVETLGISDDAIAFGVKGYFSKNEIQHITLRFKDVPSASNSIENWIPLASPFSVIGTVKQLT